MSRDFWEEVQTIYAAALEAPATAREQILDARCRNEAALRTEVESLLASHDRMTGFLDLATMLEDGTKHRAPSASARTGERIGHYELIDKIGDGGMGDVFRARDHALGRDVALKLLSQTFEFPLRDRLRREAEATARLQHPAIATFYDAGEANGETFIAMEFVQGPTLRERLRSGPLPSDQALAMTCSLLQALAHAHAAGLLHRDIKPENIIITTAGVTKLLDFSIAMPLSAPVDVATQWSPQQTETTHGEIVGTIGYLAPEQLTGERLDVRTDLFQVGAVLYEALIGKRAFPGASPHERLTALMTGEPDFSELASVAVPAGVRDLLCRALAREPAQRPPDAPAFLRELQDLTTIRIVATGPKILAILDFDNHTDDPGMDWLGAAIGEGVSTYVARVPSVTVVPRQRFLLRLASPDCEGDPVAAALRLGCGYMVAGEIAHSGEVLSIHARIVDVATGRELAVHEVHGPLTDLFALHHRIAQGVIDTVSGAGVFVPHSFRGTTIEAHEYYTRARLLIDQFGKASLEDARELLERAVGLDDNCVDAHAALTTAYALRAIASPNSRDYEAAVASAERALEIDPHHVRANVWKGYALLALGRVDEGDAAIAMALQHDPADTDALYFAAGNALLWRCPPDARRAVSLLQRALAIDPNHGIWWLALGTAHRCLNQLREACYSLVRARELEGTAARFATAGAAAYLAETLRREGKCDEARREAMAGVEAAERSDHAYRDTFRAHALAVVGRVALDQQDHVAGQAAFQQVLAQARGRPRPRACGHFVVQALCGLARATGDVRCFVEAQQLFNVRHEYNFQIFFGALNEDTLFELAHAALVVGRPDESARLMQQAIESGTLQSLPAGVFSNARIPAP